jgi:hypothetical protein
MSVYCIKSVHSVSRLRVLLSGLWTGDEEQDSAEEGSGAEANGNKEESVILIITGEIQFASLELGCDRFTLKVVEALLPLALLIGWWKIRGVTHLPMIFLTHFIQNGLLLFHRVNRPIPAGLFETPAGTEKENGAKGSQAENEAADGQVGEVLAIDHRIYSESITLLGIKSLCRPIQSEHHLKKQAGTPQNQTGQNHRNNDNASQNTNSNRCPRRRV